LLKSAPLGDGQIDDLFAPLAGASVLLLAASGGPDSTALVLMAGRWARNGGRPPVSVATVDHGLRDAAKAEAAMVGALAARLGLRHDILAWRGEKPRTRIQERARDARYALLADHARALGADTIVTAHHADDQAETVLFRLLRGSGPRGLRGMDAFSEINGVALARPLLGLRKGELIEFCRAAGEPFADDPSNIDPAYARARLRGLMPVLKTHGLGPDDLARLAARAARVEDAVARQTRAAAVRLGWDAPAAKRDASALFAEPDEIALRLLADEIARVGGKPAARLERLEALFARLREAARAGASFRANIGGVGIVLAADARLSVAPETPRRMTRERVATPGPDADAENLS
jgi:tRNA(Ile)-lysidine synthase